jgi:hypothetical protein
MQKLSMKNNSADRKKICKVWQILHNVTLYNYILTNNRSVKNSWPFITTESLVPCSQEAATWSYSQAD